MIEKISPISSVHDRAADPYWQVGIENVSDKIAARQELIRKAVKNAWRCVKG